MKRGLAFFVFSVAVGVAGAYLAGGGAVLEAAGYRPARPNAGALLGRAPSPVGG